MEWPGKSFWDPVYAFCPYWGDRLVARSARLLLRKPGRGYEEKQDLEESIRLIRMDTGRKDRHFIQKIAYPFRFLGQKDLSVIAQRSDKIYSIFCSFSNS